MNKEEHIENKASKETKAMEWYNKREHTSYVSETWKMSPHDGFLTSGATTFISEVKVRENYSNEQINAFGGSFLEFKKLNGILNYKYDNNNFNQILYFVYMKDRVNVYLLNSDPNYYKWELKYLQRNDYDKAKEWKHVTLLQEKDLLKTIIY